MSEKLIKSPAVLTSSQWSQQALRVGSIQTLHYRVLDAGQKLKSTVGTSVNIKCRINSLTVSKFKTKTDTQRQFSHSPVFHGFCRHPTTDDQRCIYAKFELRIRQRKMLFQRRKLNVQCSRFNDRTELVT